MIPIITLHGTNMTIFMSVLEVLMGLSRNKEARHSFFDNDLTQVLREWLSSTSNGTAGKKWRAEVQQAFKPHGAAGGITGRAAKMFRSKTMKLDEVEENILKCER